MQGGAGGNGYPKYQGLGGNGGNVCLIAKSNIKLTDIVKKRKSFKAQDGVHSSRYQLFGNNGSDLKIHVPVGVTVILDEYKRTVANLKEENETFIVAYGGRGGDKINSYCGTKGQKFTIKIDLQLLADVGLVGYPNAGKSTLLRALSRAAPKIASYPFTTISPNLGVIEYDPPKAIQLRNDWSKVKENEISKFYKQDYRRITVADLPGLIDGAHRNIGLGHKFLKHITRTNLLLFVVDIDGFKNVGGQYYHQSWSSRDPYEVIQSLVKELYLYDPLILRSKPSILVITKLDTAEKQKQFSKIEEMLKTLKINVPSIIDPELMVNKANIDHKEHLINNDNSNQIHNFLNDTLPKKDEYFQFDNIIGISSITKYNIDELKGMIRNQIDLDAESKNFHQSFLQNQQPNEDDDNLEEQSKKEFFFNQS